MSSVNFKDKTLYLLVIRNKNPNFKDNQLKPLKLLIKIAQKLFSLTLIKFGKFTMFGTSYVSSPRCLRLKPSNRDCQAGRKCTRIHTRRSRESGPNNGGVKSRWEHCDARQSVKDDRNATKHRIGPASEGREGRGVRLR